MENKLIDEVLDLSAAPKEGDNLKPGDTFTLSAVGVENRQFSGNLCLNDRDEQGRIIIRSIDGGPDHYLTEEQVAELFNPAQEIDPKYLAGMPRAPWIGIPTAAGEVTGEQLDKWAAERPKAYSGSWGMDRQHAIERQAYMAIHSYKGFRPLSDQVLVRPLPADDKIARESLIVIPANHDRGRLDNKLGVVLALGPGDPVSVKCDFCDGGIIPSVSYPHGEPSVVTCGGCKGAGFTGEFERTEFAVSVGDTVLFAPRGWAEIEIAGESLILVHDCQHILAVVDPDAVLFTEDPTTKKKGPDWVK